jgi:trigger factor
MKISLEELSKLERRLHIHVPVEKVGEAFDKVFRGLQGQVQLPGFRKGKAPLPKIKSMYKDRVGQDVVNQLVSEYYTKALSEKALNPINYPNIQIAKFSDSEPFEFTAEFEIGPDIKIEQYANLPVEREIYEDDPGHVDKVLENIRKGRAEMTAVEEARPAKMGDFAIIDFEGTMNGQAVENASGKEHTLELGSNTFIPGFEEAIVGMTVGETRSIPLVFPTQYHAEQLAGQPVVFKVELKGLKKQALPELNDELATSVGIETMEKLRTTIGEDRDKSEKKRIEEDLKNRLVRALVDRNPTDVPKSMLEEQKQILIQDMQKRMEGQGLTSVDFEEYKKKWDEDFTKSATFMIQSGLLVQALAQQEKLVATDSDVEERLTDYASKTGIELEKVRSFYAQEERLSQLKFKITEEKVVQLLMDKAAIREVKKSELRDYAE